MEAAAPNPGIPTLQNKLAESIMASCWIISPFAGKKELLPFLLPAAVTVYSTVQLGMFIGKYLPLRKELEIPADESHQCTNPEFRRAFRAACNRMEWFPVVQANMWVAAVVCSPTLAGLAGAAYAYSSNEYVEKYSKDENRGPAFYTGLQAMYALMGLTAVGISLALLKHGAGVDVFAAIRSQLCKLHRK